MSKKKRWPETLGDTVWQIAESLEKQGARGIPGDCRNCIVARSYRLQYPNGWSGLKVGYSRYRQEDGSVTYSARMSFNDCQIMDPHMSFEFSRTLGEFMHRFDTGEFPSLQVGAIPSVKDVLSKLTTEERIAIGK